MSTNNTQVQPPIEPKAPKSVAAIVALVLGVIALLTSLVPIVNNMSFVFALVGVVFAIVGLVGTLRGKKSGKGIAIVSVVVNVLAMVLVLASQSAYSNAIDDAFVDTSEGTVASSSATGDQADGGVSTSDQGTASSADEGQASTESQNSGSSSEASKYTITDEQLQKETYTCTISGTFTNTSGKELSYVGLTYNLFDASGNQIDNAYANTSHLADGASWKFEASSLGDPSEVASYTLADVTAY